MIRLRSRSYPAMIMAPWSRLSPERCAGRPVLWPNRIWIETANKGATRCRSEKWGGSSIRCWESPPSRSLLQAELSDACVEPFAGNVQQPGGLDLVAAGGSQRALDELAFVLGEAGQRQGWLWNIAARGGRRGAAQGRQLGENDHVALGRLEGGLNHVG